LEKIQTRQLRDRLKGLGITSALIIIDRPDEILEKSARNLPQVQVARCEGLNVHDILRHEYLVLLRSSLEKWRGSFDHERTPPDH